MHPIKLLATFGVTFLVAFCRTTSTPLPTSVTRPAPTALPDPTRTLVRATSTTVAPTLTPTVVPTPTPTPVSPRRGDLILKVREAETVSHRLYRDGQVFPSRQEGFDAYYREPNHGRALGERGGVQFEFLLEFVNADQEIRLVRLSGDGPPKHVMNSGGRSKHFVAAAVNSWNYVAAVRADLGSERELYFGEALDDHHQGPAEQKLPPWISGVRGIYWDANDDLLLLAMTNTGPALVRVTPGAHRDLPREDKAAAVGVLWWRSEPLMRHNKNIIRDYRVIYPGEVLAVAVVR